MNGGGGRIRTFEDRSQRVYSPPHLTALVPLLITRRGSVPLFNKALNNMRFIYFSCTIATRDLIEKNVKYVQNSAIFMNKSSFFIVGKHAVIEALKNPRRKVLRIFLTEESKKNIHRDSPDQNLLRM